MCIRDRAKLRHLQIVAALNGLPTPETDETYGILAFSAPQNVKNKVEHLRMLSGAGEIIPSNDLLLYVYSHRVRPNLAGLTDALGTLAVSECRHEINHLHAGEIEVRIAYAMAALLHLNGMVCAGQLKKAALDSRGAIVCKYLPAIIENEPSALEMLFPLEISWDETALRFCASLAWLWEAYSLSFHQLEAVVENIAQLPVTQNIRHVRQVIHRLLHFIHADPPDWTAEKCKADRIDALNAYVAENYSRSISLADVAAALGIPRQRVCDIMKTAHGVTFVNYLNNYRVEQAQKMLGESDLPLERIGASTGFSSPSYFIRVFKDFTGLTPGEYRKLIRNGGGQNETHPGV